ncbi:hypothetical protein [Bradyrhizobium sp. 5.13L]
MQIVAFAMAKQAQSCPKDRRLEAAAEDEISRHSTSRERDMVCREVQVAHQTHRRCALSLAGRKRFGSGLADVRFFLRWSRIAKASLASGRRVPKSAISPTGTQIAFV